MNAVDFILDGLVQELELERELGVRSVEFDRALLKPPRAVASPVAKCEARDDDRRPVEPADRTVFDFVFLHDRPLSPQGIEMMAKIIAAMGRTAETAPVIIAPPPPKARIYVVLGGLALRKFFPALKGAPGLWLKDVASRADVLVTYSPEYILRFGEVTPAVKQMKQSMW